MTESNVPSDRDLAEAMIGDALQVVVDAEGRDYTTAELDTLMYCLTMGAVKIKKLPGGAEAAKRTYEKAENELARRGAPYKPPKMRDALRWALAELERLPEHDAARIAELRKDLGL